MESIFARASTPSAPSCLSLKVIYAIRGDRSYDVTRTDPGRTGYIALRTLEGEGLLILEGRSPLTLARESLVFFPNAEIDRYWCSGTTWVFWWFEFDCDAELDFPLGVPRALSLEAQERQGFTHCLRMLQQDSPLSTPLASLALTQLYLQWVKLDRERDAPCSPYRESIYRVIEHMQAHLGEPFRVGEAASSLGLGERRFQQIFKAVMGETPKRHFETMRSEAAEDLLKRSSFTLSEITERLGYSSSYHFSRAFSKAHGLSPSAFRKGCPRERQQ